MTLRVLRRSLIASAALLPGQAMAQSAVTLDEISVVSNTPVATPRRVVTAPTASGLREVTVLDGIDRNKLPHNTSVLTSADVSRVGFPSVLRSLDERVASISINNAQGNPFQPTITYRGFEASPLGGSPQGVAVYVNGARFNTSFGDTVQWDLIPDIAVDRIELEGSNPAFGLNALGGSLSVNLKNGFTYQGSEINLLGGSFGRGAVAFQHGQKIDNIGLYVAGNVLGEEGWRKHSPSRLNQIYADLGVQAEKGEFHFNVIGASNSLTGNGTAPTELLKTDRSDVFTYPDLTKNDFLRFQLSGNYDITPTVSVQANAYYGIFKQRTANGDAADVENCAAGGDDDDGDDDRRARRSRSRARAAAVDNSAFLCSEGADDQQFFLRDRSGNPVRADSVRTFNFGGLNPGFADRFDEGGPYAFLNQTRTDTDNFGGTIQTTVRESLFGLPNRFVLGGSYDGGRTRFSADNSIGGLTLDRGFSGPGTVVSSDDGVITPVSVRSSNDYGGIYFSNNTDLTDRLTLTLQGRFNMAKIVLRDQIGTALNGDHYYERFNPGIGATYKIIPDYLSIYGGYSEANRAPTPAELSCADPAAPCSLTNFFVGDPPLKQVVARTVEAGFRGRIPEPDGIFGGILSYKAGVFSTRNDDDILFVPALGTIGRAYFRNVGSTKRQGVEASLVYNARDWTAFVDYAFVDATFQSPVELAAPGNPFNSEGGSEDGTVLVRPGNRLPGVAPHQLKVGVQYQITPEWRVGALARFATGKYLVGDPTNRNKTTGDYAVFGFNTSYRVAANIELYGYVENAFNAKYNTFGTFSPVQEVPIVSVPNATSNRSLAPAAPVAAFGGLRILFDPPPPPPPVEALVRKG